MEKRITDAGDISENYDVILKATKGIPFSAKRSAWDKISKTFYEDLKKTAVTAKKAKQTANVARSMANRAADEVKFKRRGKQRELARLALLRANKAGFVANKAETKARQAENRHAIAEQEDSDVQMTYCLFALD